MNMIMTISFVLLALIGYHSVVGFNSIFMDYIQDPVVKKLATISFILIFIQVTRYYLVVLF